jgi:hypothetical protein
MEASMGLKEQIEAWPEAMRAARLRVAEASAEFSEVDQALMQATDRHTDLVERAAEQCGDDDDGLHSPLFRNPEALQRIRQAEEVAQAARTAMNQAKAAADVQLRREAEQAGKRVTETALRAQVQLHPDVVGAEQRWQHLRAQAAEVHAEAYRQTGRGESDAKMASFDEAIRDAAAEVAELQTRRAKLLGKLEYARAEAAHQRAVGKSLDMLTRLAVAEMKAQQTR